MISVGDPTLYGYTTPKATSAMDPKPCSAHPPCHLFRYQRHLQGTSSVGCTHSAAVLSDTCPPLQISLQVMVFMKPVKQYFCAAISLLASLQRGSVPPAAAAVLHSIAHQICVSRESFTDASATDRAAHNQTVECDPA